jgi:hypothetical protein
MYDVVGRYTIPRVRCFVWNSWKVSVFTFSTRARPR